MTTYVFLTRCINQFLEVFISFLSLSLTYTHVQTHALFGRIISLSMQHESPRTKTFFYVTTIWFQHSRNLSLARYYYLTYNLCSNFSYCPNNSHITMYNYIYTCLSIIYLHFKPMMYNQWPYIAFSCHVSLVLL